MIIKELNRKIRCEMPNCKNLATKKIEKSGFFSNVGLCLCNECINDLYKCLSTEIVPKSPENMLNKKIRLKEIKGEK